MITLLIIIGVIGIGFLLAIAVFFPTKKETVTVSVNSSKDSSGRGNWEQTSNRLDNKRIRKHQIWLVLRYMITYKALLDSFNFYDFKKNLIDYKYSKGELRKSHPTNYSFDAAIRFCKTEYYYGTCTHQLTNDDIDLVYSWQTNEIDFHEILGHVLQNYQIYWDEVLDSYVRPSARIKRLHYLVDNLEEFLKLPDLQEYSDITEGMRALQARYKSQIAEME